MENKELVRIWKEAWDETIVIMKDNKMSVASKEKSIRTEQQYYDTLNALKRNMEGTCEAILSFLKPDDLLYDMNTSYIIFLKGKISRYYSLLLKSGINSQRTSRISKKLIKTQTSLYAILNYLKKYQDKNKEEKANQEV